MKKTLSDEELARRLGASTVRDYSPGAGVGLGYVRLEPPRDRPDQVCRKCGQVLGPAAWAQAVSNGAGGLLWHAPICDRCTQS
jgi:hypothetical protein